MFEWSTYNVKAAAGEPYLHHRSSLLAQPVRVGRK
jgi:hypothetical protein